MIIVFGSINVDFVTRVNAIPKPGETVLGPNYDVIPGGKGANQALAARRAGASVALVGAVGRDPFADIGLALLRNDGVDLSATEAVDAPTGAAFITVDEEGENAITVASGANAETRATSIAKISIGKKDVLLMQREVPEQEQIAAARFAKDKGARVILNVAPAGAIADELAALVDVLIMNEHEAAAVAKGMGLTGDTPEHHARMIAETRKLTTIVTLGAEGAVGWTDGVRRHIPAFPVTVVDTTAAGDAFCGAFAAALDRGFGFTTALARGVAAGSLTCTKAGAQPSLPSSIDIETKLKDWNA
jgi:ribokinase